MRILKPVCLFLGAGLATMLAAWSAQAQTAWPCPKGVPADAKCYSDRDANGAYVLAAVPAKWDGVLIVHAHGGPRLGALKPDSNDQDLSRFALFVREGHAWVNSSYRRPGYGARMAVEDTENARHYFLDKIAPLAGQPKLVIAHGQSWGGNVAAKLIELDATRPAGDRAYRGALLTSAVLPGGARGYWFRADLRAVYQYYCRNMPRPDEPSYPVAIGLPAGAKLDRKDFEARINACTGLDKPAAERTPEQRQALADIAGVVKIAPTSLMGHMRWSTYLFQDMVQHLLGGKNPFSNQGVVYAGSHDDAALNRGVERFAADPQARAALDDDSATSGKFAIPVVSMHAIHDPTAFVENDAAYRAIVDAAGNGDRLVQTFVDEAVHSKLHSPQYVAALDALIQWIEKGDKPTPQGIAAACERHREAYQEPCAFVPDFKPSAYDSRVPSR